MKNLVFYQQVLGCKGKEQVFDYLIKNLKPSNMLWTYFVNWDKVFENTKQIEIALNILNYLIGKENFDAEFKSLIKQHPEIIKVLPMLAVRNGGNTAKFEILVKYKQKKLVYENYDFDIKNPTEKDIEKYLTFIENVGIKELLISKKVKNLVDYTIGVEAGLDSNGRKNRSGHAMEDIVEVFIKDICKSNGYKYLQEANAKKIQKEWGYNIPVDKSSRRYDFVIDNGKELFIFETNYYGGGGSKLKSTAGEYRNLFDVLRNKYKFIWITDGKGWEKTRHPLNETFEYNDYLFNLSMLENGILEFLLKQNA